MRWACLMVAACRLEFDPIAAPDARSHDPDARAARCPDHALVCDDFEGGDFSKWTGTRTTDGPLSLSTAEVHGGAHALLATVDPATGSGGETYVFFHLGAERYVAARAWFLLRTPVEDSQGTIYFTNAAEDRYLEVTTDAQWEIVRYDGAVLPGTFSTTPPVQGAWTCLELDWDRDAGTAILNVGGGDAVSISYPDQAIDTVAIGATRANATGLAVFVDDAVVADSPIGCN